MQTLPTDQYRLIRVLGTGSMGEVWLAHDQVLNRDVAIKSLKITAGRQSDAAEWFLREARAAARLNHPNVITIHQVLHGETEIALVLELLGGSLAEELSAKGPMDWRDATTALRDVAEGLLAAHAAGLVHRDIKPANLLRSSRGTVKIADFGLVHVYESNASLGAGMVLGTPSYMPPEQCHGEAADARSDLYALACTYYELLTGRPPFTGADSAEVLHHQVNSPCPDPRQLMPQLPDGVCRVLFKGLQKLPEQRYQSAREMLIDLDSLLHSPDQSHVFGSAAATLLPGGEMGSKLETPNNLPQQLTSFVGREREISTVTDLLRQNRLVTILGAGGVGKTRLSLRVAADVLPDHPGGVWFVELAPLSVDGDVVQAVASTLELPEQADPPLQAVTRFLKPRRAMLILDNCEHVIGPAAEMAGTLLQACPNLRVLATSREALAVSGEVAFAIPPLRLPDLKHLPPLDQLLQYEAVKLFADRAAAAKPGFVLTAATGPTVAQICHRLDGIPLALELAASRVRVLTLERIRQRLDDQFKLLTGGSRTDLPHHQTLRATIDWSHNLLGEPEKMLLRRLAVFAGDAALEAVESVCSGDGLDQADVLDALTNLHDKSLISASERSGEMRYGMLQMVQQYAADKLKSASEEQTVRQRHLDYFYTLVDHEDRRPGDADINLRIQRLTTESDNIRAAMIFAAESPDPRALALGLSMGSRMRAYWHHAIWPFEGAMALDCMLSHPHAKEAPVAYARALLALTTHAVRWRSRLKCFQTRTIDEAFDECMRLFRESGNEADMAELLINRSCHQKHRPTSERAAMLEQAVELSRRAAESGLIARALELLGEIALQREDFHSAQRMLEEAFQRYVAGGHQLNAATLMRGAMYQLHQRRPLPHFRERLAEHLAFLERLSSPLIWRQLTAVLAQLHAEDGHEEQAYVLFEQLLQHATETGDEIGECGDHYYYGEALLRFGRYRESETHMRRMLEIADREGRADTWGAVHYLGQACYCQQRYPDAETTAKRALRAIEAADMPEGHSGRSELQTMLVLCHIRTGRIAEALAPARKALEHAGGHSLVAAAALAVAHERPVEAARLLAGVHQHFSDRHSLFPAARWEFEQRVQELRSSLPADALNAAWAAGLAMSTDQLNARAGDECR